jgi:hypothetical protein
MSQVVYRLNRKFVKNILYTPVMNILILILLIL